MGSQSDLGHILAGKSGVAAHDAALVFVTFSFSPNIADWSTEDIAAFTLDRRLQFLHWRFAATSNLGPDAGDYGRVRILLNDGGTVLGNVSNNVGAFNNVQAAGGYVGELSSLYLHVLPVRSNIRIRKDAPAGNPGAVGLTAITLTFRTFE